ncbi:MAG: ROK family transcriptional regulator [Rhodospirillales bacterium]|nr:ROK family transcriptional regulator [Rhodospirillales bacterium]
MLVAFDDIHETNEARETDRQKARLFFAIGETEHATRKRLAKQFGIRPSTVTALVKELIEDGLVSEGRVAATARKGRPEIYLNSVPGRQMALVIHIVSHDIRGVLLDINGEIRIEHAVRLDDKQADNEGLSNAFRQVAMALLDSVPFGAEVPGIAVSVPGIVDSAGGRWVYASRWPRMAGMTFEKLVDCSGLPTRVERNLNLELRARLQRRADERNENILFVHWGHGIGSAHARNGHVLNSGVGSMGEFGHWTTARDEDRACICGQKGCLETEAALWALLPAIRRDFPDAPADEWAFERFLRSNNLAGHPVIQEATEIFARNLRNLYMAFFPDRIILTGPFVQNDRIMTRLDAEFRNRLPVYSQGLVSLRAARPGVDDEILGSALPVFQNALRDLLLARGTKGY